MLFTGTRVTGQARCPCRRRVGACATILLMAVAAVASGGEANHPAIQLSTVNDCSLALENDLPLPVSGTLNGAELSLVSWNIEKGLNDGWRSDLESFGRDMDLILLQEAVYRDEMLAAVPAGSRFWSFSPGYRMSQFTSGLMTLSEAPPDILCSIQHQEPWLNTPKSSSVTRFELAGSEQSLLLVNMHQINFEIGIGDFSRQLRDVAKVMQRHTGPIILSGDFNTWKQSRIQLLQEITSGLGLSPVSFMPDHRKTFMGYPLDHVFIRGFEVKDSYTIQVESSDHNPLILKLALKKA